MRYLGAIGDQIKDQNMNYMKYIIEREVMLRSIKHLMNKYLKECESDEIMAATVSHILNLILAPKDFLKRMDDKTIKYQAEIIGNEVTEVAAKPEASITTEVTAETVKLSKKEI